MIHGLLFVTFSIILLSGISIPVKAQEYSFDVDSEKVNVYIEKDGSTTIEYWITFTCHSWADEIDWVDIGFPNEHYDINSITAELDGHTVSVIGPSPYIDYGVEIKLGPHAIQPGKSGTLHVRGNNPQMVYEDYEDQNLASVVFSPTWFDSDFCDTYEYLEVNIYFPDGLKDGSEVKYYDEIYTKFSRAADGDLIFTWIKTNVAMKQYTFGVSFPKTYVDTYYAGTMNPVLVSTIVGILLAISVIGLIVGGGFLIYSYNKHVKNRYYPPKAKRAPIQCSGSMCCFALAGLFFLFSFWVILGDILLIIGFFVVVVIGFGMIGYLIFRLISKRMEKLPYSKPNIKIDSIGVNKNLTVVEAAIIQNVPLKKVVFLIIFSLIRTGHLRIVGVDPIKFEVLSSKGVSNMRIYQKKFLDSIIKTGGGKGILNDRKLEKLLVDLIKATDKKMRGFQLERTTRYYQNIIDEAWKEVKAMPKEINWEDIENNYDWLVLDEHFKENSQKYFSNRYYYRRPYWYHNYYYHSYYWRSRRYYTAHAGATAKSLPLERININNFSNSIVRGIENVSNSIVTNFSNFAEKIIGTVRPVQVKASTRGRGYGGGGGCACACACAGCACACAGGGR